MPVKNGFQKGELIYNRAGFPAFVYERQMAKGYISIYAFGYEDEHGSEYPEQARRIKDKEEFFNACKGFGFEKDYVIQKAKEFKVAL
jgi:hypothetical protein